MKTASQLAMLVLVTCNLSAGTLHVSLLSTNPVPPYTNWVTAATNIQDAVDAATLGDTVLVTNGVYAVGERTTTNEWDLVEGSRVLITKAIRLESVNGPLVTTIEGSNGYSLIRCVYLGSNAMLSGFTLTNGATGGGEGLHCWGSGGGAYGGTLTNCTVTGNWAGYIGGGVAHSTVYNCTLSANSSGGDYSTLYNCTVTGNGGGAAYSTLSNCTVTANSDFGAYGSTLYNCTVTGNSGWGAAFGSTLYNCTVTGNSYVGASGSTLYNCTVTGNDGGGVDAVLPWFPSTVCNSIIYGNTNGNYDQYTALNYCLTTPLPTNGVGNIAADPGFVNAAAGNYHLRPNSPCIDAGTNLLSLFTTDLDGEFRPWDGNGDGVAAFDIGAYEFRPSPVTLYVSLLNATPAPPFETWATAATNIQDAVDAAVTGDTVLVTNGVYGVGGKTNEWGYVGNRVTITNSIKLESVNGPLVTMIDGGWDGEPYSGIGIRCVYLSTNATLSGFTLRNGVAGGCAEMHCWGSGGGAYGGTLTNCTVTGNWAGSRGGGVAYSTVYNCTLIGNSAQHRGGGANYSTLYNCTLTGNSALFGGGAYDSTLYNCTLTGNIGNYGGGASGSTLYNCTLSGNWAYVGGGASGGTLYNCTVTGNDGGGVGYDYWATGSTGFNSIVFYNFGGNYDEGTVLNFSCTTPLPTNGVGNITGPPLFMDWAAEDFRLREESPCIDAGTNLIVMNVGYTFEPTDILGNTRFIDGNFDGTVAWDMGAYEFNSFKPPRFTSGPRLTASGWQLNITGAANQWVHVQRSSNLKDWEDIWFGWMGSEGVKQVTDGDMGQQKMFYRAVVE